MKIIFIGVTLLTLSSVSQAVIVPSVFSIVFGEATDLAPACVTSGSSGNRNCSKSLTLNNGDIDGSAKFSVSAQASADVGSELGNVKASASLQINYAVPFTITRQVNVVALDGQYVAVAPDLSLEMDYVYGAVAATLDDSALLGKSRADLGELTVTLTDAAPWTVGSRGQSDNLDVDVLSRNASNANASRDINLATGPSVGEVGSIADIPLSFNLWADQLPDFIDYTANSMFQQTYNGLVSVEILLTASSESDPLIGFGNGSEAIACFGRSSGLSSFVVDQGGCPVGFGIVLDDLGNPVDDGGLVISGELLQTGTAIALIGAVPVPATFWLFGSALMCLFGLSRR